MSDNVMNDVPALVLGQPYTDLPKDLYIPPDALRVLLVAFEGPLDLLLYLIRKHNFDILNIPVAEITEQYLVYMQLMEELDMGLAAEYLLMAATLGEIKARLLFPKPQSALEEEGGDPRLDLIAQLQAYAQTKAAAEFLAQCSRVGNGVYLSGIEAEVEEKVLPPVVDTKRLWLCMEQLGKLQAFRKPHHVAEERLELSACLQSMRARVGEQSAWQDLQTFYTPEQGREGQVLNLMAMLELDKEQAIEWYQTQYFAPVYLKSRNK